MDSYDPTEGDRALCGVLSPSPPDCGEQRAKAPCQTLQTPAVIAPEPTSSTNIETASAPTKPSIAMAKLDNILNQKKAEM